MKCPKCGQSLVGDVIPTVAEGIVMQKCVRHGMQHVKKDPDPVPTGQQLAQRGAEQAERAAAPGWKDDIRRAIRQVAYNASDDDAFNTDPVWDLIDEWGIPDQGDRRVIAALMAEAVGLGLLVNAGGWLESTRPEAHRNPKRTYRKGPRARREAHSAAS